MSSDTNVKIQIELPDDELQEEKAIDRRASAWNQVLNSAQMKTSLVAATNLHLDKPCLREQLHPPYSFFHVIQSINQEFWCGGGNRRDAMRKILTNLSWWKWEESTDLQEHIESAFSLLLRFRLRSLKVIGKCNRKRKRSKMH